MPSTRSTLGPDWRRLLTLRELRRGGRALDGLYADDVVFEHSKARCLWEASLGLEEPEQSASAESVAEAQTLPPVPSRDAAQQTAKLLSLSSADEASCYAIDAKAGDDDSASSFVQYLVSDDDKEQQQEQQEEPALEESAPHHRASAPASPVA
jgi:hypothetical protein